MSFPQSQAQPGAERPGQTAHARALYLLPLVVSLAAVLTACGKDETDFNNLKGQVGVVAGNFNMRLAEFYRDKIDALQAKIDGVAPGLTTQFSQRYAGNDASTDGKTKLSDLMKVKFPGTESEVINQQIFKELQRLSGEYRRVAILLAALTVVNVGAYALGVRPLAFRVATIEDRDRAAGLFYLRYADPEKAGEEEPNFFQRLFGAKAAAPVRYRVSVKTEGNVSTVKVLDDKGVQQTNELAKRILQLLMEDVR